MSNNKIDSLEQYRLPWLIFKIGDSNYAINSKSIAFISNLPEIITSVPNTPEYVKGIVNSRDKVIALIELRSLFSMKSIDEEFKEFRDMIDARKNDHTNWVIELKRCLNDIKQFKLAEDPHKCKLGIWYDNFETDNQLVRFHLNKLDEPHKKLHSLVHEARQCEKMCEQCQRDECLQVTLVNNLDKFESHILGLLDGTKEVFKEYYKQTIVEINNVDVNLGVVVDKVLGIETLECTYMNELDMSKSKFLLGTAINKENELVLLLDEKIFEDIASEIEPSLTELAD